MSRADEALQVMENLARAVADGRESAERLALGLDVARSEVDTLLHQMADDTFVTDEAAQTWRSEAVEALEGFRGGLYVMLGALQETVDSESLLLGLEQALAAERRVRELYARASATREQVRQAIEASQRVTCVRCGHGNGPGRTTCERCKMQLPQTGQERIEVDVIGGDQGGFQESAFLVGLEKVIGGLEQPGGQQQARSFVENLERLHLLARKRLDALMARQDPRQEAVQYTMEIRRRVEDVREMLEAVRLALDAGDSSPLQELPPWLAGQFQEMHELKQAVVEVAEASQVGQ